jgi:hypothetical protein
MTATGKILKRELRAARVGGDTLARGRIVGWPAWRISG